MLIFKMVIWSHLASPRDPWSAVHHIGCSICLGWFSHLFRKWLLQTVQEAKSGENELSSKWCLIFQQATSGQFPWQCHRPKTMWMSLEAQSQNLRKITLTALHWQKHITKQAQTQRVQNQIFLFKRRSCKYTLDKTPIQG